MYQTIVNWLCGGALVLIGVYHTWTGAPKLNRWLQLVEPALTIRERTMGSMGFVMGGFLAVAVGLTFLVIGRALPRNYYLLWAIVLAALGGLSVYSFRGFHVSKIVLLLSVLLLWYYIVALCDYRASRI